MKVIKLAEYGYEEAVLGFSLSFNSTIDRAKELLPKYAFGTPGENKFLRVIWLWFDIDLPRLIYPEIDQYKIAATTLSESTVHTLHKNILTTKDFIKGTDQRAIDLLNEKILAYQNKEIDRIELKSNLPEGFLQRRIWNINYATLQNIVLQRKNHRVKLWDTIISEILSQIDHPEFVVKGYTKCSCCGMRNDVDSDCDCAHQLCENCGGK